MGSGAQPLVSLFQLMYEYSISDFVLMLNGLLTASNMLKFAKSPHEALPDPEWLHALNVSIDGLHILAEKMELDSSLVDQISKLRNSTSDGKCDLPAIVVKDKLDTIIDGVQENLGSRHFMYVPRDQAPYWENPELFGEDFLIGFPKAAVWEMKEAGNCYAVGRWTACVFHAMRVAEHGLRRLAKRLRVTISSKGKNCPLEYGDWETVITQIRNKIKETRLLPRGPKRERALQFYSTAADHCEYMKDIWRNEASHARRVYTKAESRAALTRVSDFMKPLAKTEADAVVRKRIRAAKLKSMGNLVSLKTLMSLAPDEAYRKFGGPPVTTKT